MKSLTKKALGQVTVHASPFEVADALKQTLPVMGFPVSQELSGQNPLKISLRASSGMTLRSWGEEITVEVFEDGYGGSIVVGESKASLPTTIVDYGRNKENLERIFQVLLTKYKGTMSRPIEEKVV